MLTWLMLSMDWNSMVFQIFCNTNAFQTTNIVQTADMAQSHSPIYTQFTK